MKKKTYIQYCKEVERVHGNSISVTGNKYTDARTKIKHLCNICGYIWMSIPDNIVNKIGIDPLEKC